MLLRDKYFDYYYLDNSVFEYLYYDCYNSFIADRQSYLI